MVTLNNNVRFNEKLYLEYRRKAGKNVKNGHFTETVYPNGKYCFVTRQELGNNGNVYDHPLLGQKYEKNGKIYTIDSVCIHFMCGYYYHVTLKDEKNSHTCAFIENINSVSDIIIDGVEYFKKNFKLIDMGKSKEIFTKQRTREVEENLDNYGDNYIDYVDEQVKYPTTKDGTCEED